MNRMQVYIPKNMIDDLKHVAVIRDVSMSQLIREGLKKILYTDKKGKFDPMADFVGKCKKKIKTDAVEEIKDYYKNL